MRRSVTLLLVIGLTAACGGRGDAGPVSEPSAVADETSSTQVESSISTTSFTTTTTLPAPTTTARPSSTTSSTMQAFPVEPTLVTGGTSYPIGTPVPISLPDGAIGPNEDRNTGNDSLRALIGVSTYRLRTTAIAPIEPGSDQVAEASIQVDVVEGETADDVDEYIQESVDDGEELVTYEMIIVGDRYFTREPGRDWDESSGGYDIVGPVMMIPYDYASMSGVRWSIAAAEWLGNEEIDGVPVGHFRWSEGNDEVTRDTEYWIDGDGVVWRLKTRMMFGDQLFYDADTVLCDVGADITVEAPDGL